jgi:hypothetical protein
MGGRLFSEYGRGKAPATQRPPRSLKTRWIFAHPTGAFTIYAFGEITCREVFNNSWTSRFRFMYGGQGGEKPKGANGQRNGPAAPSAPRPSTLG